MKKTKTLAQAHNETVLRNSTVVENAPYLVNRESRIRLAQASTSQSASGSSAQPPKNR